MKKRTKQLLAVLTAVTLLLSLAACGGEPAAPASSAPPAPASGPESAAPAESAPAEAEAENVKIPQEELDAFCAKAPEELILEYLGEDPAASTEEQRMEFAAAQRYSWLEDYKDHFEMLLPDNYTAALRLLREQGVELPDANSQFMAFADSEYPTLRMAAFRGMDEDGTWDEASLALAKERTEKETVYYVLGYMLDALSNEAKDPVISDFILRMSAHEDDIVRATSAHALAYLPDDRMDEAVDGILKLMADPNQEVRIKACIYADDFDERVLPGLRTILMDREDHACHNTALSSLKNFWFGSFGKAGSPDAYALTLEYLKQTPRDQNVPNWLGISKLPVGVAPYLENWKSEADFFDSADFIDTMLAIAEDPDASGHSRSAAVETAAAFASDAELDGIRARVQAVTDDAAADLMESFEDAVADRA